MELRGLQNEDKVLILRYDEKGKFHDITTDVAYLKETTNSFYISFKRFDGGLKSYHFSKSKIRVFLNGDTIEGKGQELLLDGSYYFHYDKIIRFGHFYKVLIGNKSIVGKEFKFIDKASSNNHFNVLHYYKELATHAAKLSRDKNSVEENLLSLYMKMQKIDANTFLASYMTKDIKANYNHKILIHPYGLNISQYEAIKKVFSYNISIIEGPPGTGKTQTIMNIIANAIIDDRKIAVISNNNTAIFNIYEKLEEKGLEFICANLGNYDNVTKFFDENHELKLKKFMTNYIRGASSLTEIKENTDLLITHCEFQNQLLELKDQLNQLKLEYKHYQNKVNYNGINFKFRKINSEVLLELRQFLNRGYRFKFIEKLLFKYRYGISYKVVINNVEEILMYIDKLYYELKIQELIIRISDYELFLKKNSFNNLIKNNTNLSLNYFKNYLFNKYKNNNDFNFNIRTYRNKITEFTKRFPLVLSTTHSLLRNVGNDFCFDILVIDEASQSDILSSILTFNISKRVVIVGDSQQLPQIDNQSIYGYSDQLISKYQIPVEFQYKENSILNSIKSFGNVPTTLLKEHYRCEPRIIRFCNKKFYSGELIINTEELQGDSMVVIKTVPGNHARRNPYGNGQYNLREVDEIIEILDQERTKEIGIITPFRYQADVIREKTKNYDNVEVDTIHKFQGRQKDIIILSTVVNNLFEDEINEFISNFVTNDRLLNVAISRAKSKLYIVVADKVYYSKKNSIQELIDYIKYNFSHESQNEGTVVSVFDCLYKDNINVLKKVKTKLRKVSSFDTENIIYDLLQNVLKDYHNLKILMHIKLSHLVNDLKGFSNTEKKYITNPFTHVDFVIYNELTKLPILVIEVDGIKFHEQNIVQSLRDDIKDRVLEANNIPILRLKTNESKERSRIINKLNELNFIRKEN